jgi:hypothetical protein
MRRIGFVLVLVLMLAAPARAEVLITGVVGQGDDANVVISFVNSEGQHVRGFALDIIVDGGAVITAVECLNSDYYVYPGSIEISDNEVTNPGTCVCDGGEYDDTLGGLDTNGVTVELASLYSPNDPEHPNAPADSGDLLKITLSGNDQQTVCIRANGLRGGVVMEDVTSVDPNAPCFEVVLIEHTCMKNTHPDYDVWQSVGQPCCWCYPRQCRGDVDNAQEYGIYWVLLNDLDVFKNCFGVPGVLPGEPCICADCNHDLEYGAYRVLLNDLECFAAWFGQTNVPCCDQDEDCDLSDGDQWFNWWGCVP